MKRVAVLIDPYHDYATSYLEALHQIWGLQSVCLYTDRRGVLRNAYRHAELASSSVAASHWISGMSIPAVASALRSEYEVVAVIPHVENLVLPASRLAAALGLTWGPEEMMRAFRDKSLLKSRIRAAGGVRVNHTALVHTAADVRGAVEEYELDRVVLKPNDGLGNINIGFFDRGTPDSDVTAFLGGRADPPFLLEEFISGPEYLVNGQTDENGRVDVVFVAQTFRTEANGRANVAKGQIQISRSDPRFAVLADYVRSAVEATGLQRNPFHAEVLIDDQGPCLIEVAARLCGLGMANEMNQAHDGKLNLFQVAAHYYLTDGHFGPIGLDWDAYDRRTLHSMCGISYQRGRIWRVDGQREVEDMPEFVRWIERPLLGKELVLTRSLVEMPYALSIVGPTAETVLAADTRIRETLIINRGHPAAAGIADVARASWATGRAVARGLPRATLVRPRSFRT